MDPATKAEAKAKLDTLYVGVGYPETWRDYSAYEVKADDIFGNLWRGGLFDYYRNIARLGHPVDRKEWVYTPQTVDAHATTPAKRNHFTRRISPTALLRPSGKRSSELWGNRCWHWARNQLIRLTLKVARLIPQGRVRNWWKPADLAHFNAATASLSRAVRRLQASSLTLL